MFGIHFENINIAQKPLISEQALQEKYIANKDIVRGIY